MQHPWRTPFRTGKGAPMWPLTLSDDDMSVNSIPMRERKCGGNRKASNTFCRKGHCTRSYALALSSITKMPPLLSSESQKLASSVRARMFVLINAAARDKAQLGFADKVPYERG